MADGIADIDEWGGIPHPECATRQSYLSGYGGDTFGNYHPYYSAGVFWETESLSSWSNWSCDSDDLCCCCDCDCQPSRDNDMPPDGSTRGNENRVRVFHDDSQQSYRVGREPLEGPVTRDKYNAQPGLRRSSASRVFQHDEGQDILSMEDMIYYHAKQQRHYNDTQRRIQDWMRVMPELLGSDRTPVFYPDPKECSCRECKKKKKQAARRAKKGETHRRESKGKESSKQVKRGGYRGDKGKHRK